tara:strand:- start:18305 stop:18448 length:144 start_codon:yes stop_codon:yes gene_type:complete
LVEYTLEQKANEVGEKVFGTETSSIPHSKNLDAMMMAGELKTLNYNF